MATNKRQHYVPQFLLRNFASDDQRKQINIINIARRKIIRNASLRDQCYKDYMYGKKTEVEKSLCEMEGAFSSITRKILCSGKIDSARRFEYNLMMSLQHARTLRAEEAINGMVDKLVKIWLFNKVPEEDLREHKVGLEDASHFNVGAALTLSPVLLDLKQYLIINKSSVPFVISDNPVVMTNWFLRTNFPANFSTGSSIVGLQTFMPLSPWFGLMMHDGNIYWTKNNEGVVEIRRDRDAIKINEVQWMNAHKNVYFHSSLADAHVRHLSETNHRDGEAFSFHRFEPTKQIGRYRSTNKDEFAPPSQGIDEEILSFSQVSLGADIRLEGMTFRPKALSRHNKNMRPDQRDPAWCEIVRDFSSALQNRRFSFEDFWKFVNLHPLLWRVGPWLDKFTFSRD